MSDYLTRQYYRCIPDRCKRRAVFAASGTNGFKLPSVGKPRAIFDGGEGRTED